MIKQASSFTVNSTGLPSAVACGAARRKPACHLLRAVALETGVLMLGWVGRLPAEGLVNFTVTPPAGPQLVRAVADFLAATVDPARGWCYPHSSSVLRLSHEVLAYYLRHRPSTRLLAAPKADGPLGQVLERIPRTRP